MAKTRIISTKKNQGGTAAKRKGSLKKLGRKVSRTHKGYPMKSIVKSAITYKKGRKR